jgi:hypothetical protein
MILKNFGNKARIIRRKNGQDLSPPRLAKKSSVIVEEKDLNVIH